MENQNIENMKNYILKMIDSLLDREFHYNYLRNQLKEEFFTFSSKDSLKEKILKIDDNVFLERLLNKIEVIFSEYVYLGKKVVSIYEIKNIDFFHEFIKFANAQIRDNAVIEAQEMIKSFPFNVDREIFLELNLKKTYIIHIKENPFLENATDIFYSGSINFNNRKSFSYKDVTEDVRNYFEKKSFNYFDELIAIKKEVRQFISYATIDWNRNLLIIHNDSCGTDSSNEFNMLNALGTELFSSFNLDGWNKSIYQLGFENTLQAFYDEEDGKIEKIEHITASGSKNTSETITNPQGLKFDDFVQGGMDRINHNTDIYKIEKSWDIGLYDTIKPNLEVGFRHYLQVTTSNQNTRTSHCKFAVITKCFSLRNYWQLIEKLITYSRL